MNLKKYYSPQLIVMKLNLQDIITHSIGSDDDELPLIPFNGWYEY